MIRVRMVETGEIKEYEESYALRLIEQGVAVYDDGDTPVDPEPVPVDPFKYMEIFGITVEDNTGLARERHEVGDLFEYDNKLYRATAAIAQGEEIVPDTNCERKTYKEIAENKADKTDTVLLTTLSRGRKSRTTVGNGSLAFGLDVAAPGSYSQAVGKDATASAAYSKAEGLGTTASGSACHAEGSGTTASMNACHAEGLDTVASGEASHAEGVGTIANHQAQHAAGRYNVADPSDVSAYGRGTYVEIIGNGTSESSRSNARTLDWDGNEKLAGGLTLGGTLSHGRKSGTTEGEASIAFGYYVEASGINSFAVGDHTKATGQCSVAEGSSTASGNYSHAEGSSTASGQLSHAESSSTASGDWSHAEGSSTASGEASHAEGVGTIANHLAQHAAGRYNVADPSSAAATARGTYVEIIGNGTSDSNRSNARTLDWEGNETLAGSLTLGSTTLTEAQLQGLLALLNA